MNAIEILEEQHREVESMFAAFERTDDLQMRIQIFNEIADALAAHASIEEKIFYPGVKVASTEDLLMDAAQDHLLAKQLMADLLSGVEIDEDHFETQVFALRESVMSHVAEERTELFPQVRKLFGREELDAMGVEMENLYAELMSEGDPRRNIPVEATQPPPAV